MSAVRARIARKFLPNEIESVGSAPYVFPARGDRVAALGCIEARRARMQQRSDIGLPCEDAEARCEEIGIRPIAQ